MKMQFNILENLKITMESIQQVIVTFYYESLLNDGTLGKYHGVGGPVTISRNDMPYLINEWLISGKERGYPITDPNAEQRAGI